MSEARSAVASTAVLTAVRRLAADSLTAEVVRTFRQAGITPILLKGPATARWLYDGDDRLYRDVDLLVSPSELTRAEEALAGMGLTLHLDSVTPDEQVAHASRWLRAGSTASVDLHHTLPGVRGDTHRLWEALSESVEEIEVGGEPVAILAQPARALLIALHAASHGVRAVQPLTDLERALCRVRPDVWEEAWALAIRLDCHAPFAAGLRMVPDGLEVTTRLGAPERLPVEVILRATSPPETAFGFQRLSEASGVRAKARLMGREVFPTPGFMRAWRPLARRGTAGLVLAYAWRPAWLLRHALPGWRAWRRAVRDAR